ncbi:uncharacterized protein LOC117114594 [Anneissia japonica]|uniref:uncharacterized protein LOC117114594 n=1 Tax=Anneissia japonica TaxID=1529436 RepID=UPI00142559C4|nr:uncharacterized protein LOC117114594 [Anneissia japonica]
MQQKVVEANDRLVEFMGNPYNVLCREREMAGFAADQIDEDAYVHMCDLVIRKMCYNTYAGEPYLSPMVLLVQGLPKTAEFNQFCGADTMNTDNYLRCVAFKEAVVYLVLQK